MLTEGQILDGKYKIGRLLGKGGMGAVFYGENTLIKRAVAIKVLFDVDPTSENARRFEKEAQAAGRIGSDHIVEVLDLGTTPEGDRFMVMEYLDGESLKGRLARGRLKPAELVPLVTQMLDGLAAAHAAEIVHRDLKPDNIYILKEKAGRRDFVKIVDFGISKFNSLGAEGEMTKTGAVMGTPFYMSPEQARAANEVDNRSDLYAVGVLMYQAVTGAVPFNGNTFTELLFKIVFEDVAHPSTIVPDLDPAFAMIVLKAMARDASDRYQTASELKEALSSWRENPRGAVVAPLGPPPAAPSSAFKKANLAGTAILDSAPQSFPQSRPQTVPSLGGTAMLDPSSSFAPTPQHAPPPNAPPPIAQSAAPSAQPIPPSWQSPQQHQPPQFGQSVGPGSQILDASRAAPKSRAGVFAVVAVLLLASGAAAAVLVTRPGKGSHDAATPAAIEAAPPAVSAVAGASSSGSAAPSVSASSAASAPVSATAVSATPTAEAATSATEASQQRRLGARPLPTAKPTTAAPPKTNGTLKDLGY